MNSLHTCVKTPIGVAKKVVLDYRPAWRCIYVVSTWVLIPLVVLMTSPSKALPRRKRLHVLAIMADQRVNRRKMATDWFYHWAHRRWSRQPHASTKVAYHLVRHLPEFRYQHPRGAYIHFEDCLHLEQQAFMLWQRLIYTLHRHRGAT